MAGTRDHNQGSDATSRRPEPEFLAIGRVARPFGVQGELKVALLTEHPEQLDRLHTIYLGPAIEPWTVKRVRLHGETALFKLVGCDDRTTADTLRGMLVQITRADAVPLEDDEYYEHQIIGMRVIQDNGTDLGQVKEIIYTGANDVYVVAGPTGELLLPAIQSVILEIDLDADRMTVHVLDGLR